MKIFIAAFLVISVASVNGDILDMVKDTLTQTLKKCETDADCGQISFGLFQMIQIPMKCLSVPNLQISRCVVPDMGQLFKPTANGGQPKDQESSQGEQ
uniref:Saposin B-type domain-containing protein n=1 Tax=Steinernema glaseri TaxID=37863 RepID=A0A1I7ZPZ3_9BILA